MTVEERRGPDEHWLPSLERPQLDLLDGWLESNDVTIMWKDWLVDGRSGSPVAVVEWRDRDDHRKRVLKFCEHGAAELRRIRAAYASAPNVFRRHLAEPGEVHLTGEWSMVFLEIADGDLSMCRQLVSLTGHREDELAEACEQVVYSVLAEWNATLSASRYTCDFTVSDYLARLIDGGSLDPENAGESGRARRDPWARLLSWANGKVRSDVAHVDRPGLGRLPNPIAVAAGNTELSSRPVSFLAGRLHGDLNVRNVLIPDDPWKPANFVLIDCSDYYEVAPLARDPAHLLLSVAIEWLRTELITREKGQALVRAVVEGDRLRSSPNSLVKPYWEVCCAIHRAGRNYINDNKHGMRNDWRRDMLLSLAGCALLFADRALEDVASKEIIGWPDATRQWLFDVAAFAMKQLQDQWDEASVHATGVGTPANPAQAPTEEASLEPVVAPGADHDRADAEQGGSQLTDGVTGPYEPPSQACAAIAYHLNERMRTAPPAPEQVLLMLTDYSTKASLAPSGARWQPDEELFRAFLPSGGVEWPAPARVDVQPVDVVVVTANDLDFSAVRWVFGWEDREGDAVRAQVTLPAARSPSPHSAVVARMDGPLTPHEAPELDELIARYDPQAVFLVGTVSGASALRIGDVLVPYHVARYRLDGSGLSPSTPVVSVEKLRSFLDYYRNVRTAFDARAAEFIAGMDAAAARAAVSPPRVVMGADKSAASASEEFRDQVPPDRLRQEDPRILGVDSVAHSFAVRNQQRRWAAFLGVSDRGGAERSTAQAGDRFMAVGLAAVCLRDFLEHEYL